MMRFKKETLANGTRLLFVPHDDTAATALLVLYEVGSRYETARLGGAAHFLEHLMFKGTRRRPDNLAISRDLDAVGADYNAFTWRDCTGYYIKLTADRLPLAADMLGDLLHHSLLRPADLDQERGVILEEIRMYEDNPLLQVESLMEEDLYHGSALGRQVAGTVASVTALRRADLLAFQKAHYRPARTVVAVAGKFDEAKARALVTKQFGRPADGGAGPNYRRFTLATADYRRPRLRFVAKDTEQYQAALGFPSYGYGHRRLAALSVLNVILGGNMSSRLFLEVRERRGLAYFVRSAVNTYQDIGNLSIQAGIARDRLPQALTVIAAELKKLKDKPVPAEELTRAKEFIKGKMILHLEESSELAEWCARQELLEKRLVAPEEKLKRIFAVTAADVQAAARDLIRPNRLALAVIGPKTDERALERLVVRL